MRLSAPLLIVCAGLAAVWARAALPPDAEPVGAPQPARAEARDGLAAALAAAGAAPLGPLAAERGTDGLWRLRGRAARPEGRSAGWPAPLYAEARARCDARLARPGCWRLSLLEIDGAPRPLKAERAR